MALPDRSITPTVAADQPERAVSVTRPRWELAALLLIAAACAAAFVFRGYYIGDSLIYATDIFELARDGLGRLGQKFNGGVSPAYFVVLRALAKLSAGAVEFSAVMNGINAAASVLLMGVLYAFFSRLSAQRWTPLFAALAVLLSPSIWLQSHFGHPGLLSVVLFIASVLALDHALCELTRDRVAPLPWIGFALCGGAALATRIDIVLCFGAYLGLVWYRRPPVRKGIVPALVVVALAAVGYVVFRRMTLGTAALPTDKVTFHVSERLHQVSLVRTVVKNLVLWSMAPGVLIFVVGILGLARLPARHRIFGLSWILPFTIFLPFYGVDVSRVVGPTVPILAFAGFEWVEPRLRRSYFLALGGVLAAAQLTCAAMYYPIVKLYPFKFWVDGRAMAEVPLGFVVADHLYRQKWSTEMMRDAREVTSPRSGNVGIIGLRLNPYAYFLRGAPDAVRTEERCGDLVLARYATPGGSFYLCDLFDNELAADPVATFRECMASRSASIHVVPFIRLDGAAGK
jgi:hypothetical protein